MNTAHNLNSPLYRQFGGVCVGSCPGLVRGTNFSKIQYIYIFIPDICMTHLVYWLECDPLYCGFPVRIRTLSIVIRLVLGDARVANDELETAGE